MSAKVTIVKVEPVGQRVGPAFIERGRLSGLAQISSPIYPPSPNGQRLSEGRRSQNMNLREAAMILGLSPTEVSSLEMGRLTLLDEDWSKVFKLLEIREPDRVPRLENWAIASNADRYTAPECVYYFLVGIVYGHPMKNDGTRITTSELIGCDKKKHLAITKNTSYVLGSTDPKYEELFPDAKLRFFSRYDEEGNLKPILKPTGYRKQYKR